MGCNRFCQALSICTDTCLVSKWLSGVCFATWCMIFNRLFRCQQCMRIRILVSNDYRTTCVFFIDVCDLFSLVNNILTLFRIRTCFYFFEVIGCTIRWNRIWFRRTIFSTIQTSLCHVWFQSTSFCIHIVSNNRTFVSRGRYSHNISVKEICTVR